MVIYKMTDRIPVKIGDLTFKLGPLSYFQKSEIQNCTTEVKGESQIDGEKVAYLSLKYSIKEVKGLKDIKGNDYSLEYDDNGCLTDDSMSELLQIDESIRLTRVCLGLMKGFNKDVKIDGVEIDFDNVESVEKKSLQ